VDGPRSGSRSLAQSEVLRALRRVFPDPLIELRQIARPLGAGPQFDAQLAAWTAKWHLDALRDVAALHVYYWAATPAAADQFRLLKPPSIPPVAILRDRPPTLIDVEWSPPVVWEPLEQLDPSKPRDPLVPHPDYEFEADFLERAKAAYQERPKSETTPAHRRPALARHAEWFVLHDVAGKTTAAIAADAKLFGRKGGEISTITKGINQIRGRFTSSSRRPARSARSCSIGTASA
jgi:hypothetical protein